MQTRIPCNLTQDFLYLGRTVAFNNIDWEALYHNLRKVWSWWGVVAKVLMVTGAAVRAQAMIYKAVVQTVLIYGSNRWVVTGSMLKFMDGFHHQVARRIPEKTAWCIVYREWEWPPLTDALEIAWLWPIKEYIQRRQATIAEHIACQPIYELFTGVEKFPGSSKFMRW